MPFNLEIVFTGICGFVENSNASEPHVCVVMPSDVDRNAQDDEALCPHECYVEQGYGFGVTRTSIAGQRLSLSIGGGSNSPIKLPIATYTDVGLIKVADSGIKDPVDPDAVAMQPQKAPVMAQMLLNVGSVLPVDAGGFWAIDESDQQGVRVAHELIVTLTDLDSATLWLYPFTGAQPRAVDLKPATGISTAALRVVNTCTRKVYPPQRKSLRDRDFKWYYELLKQPMQTGLGSKDLPIPRYITGALIGGNNCFPGHLGSTPM